MPLCETLYTSHAVFRSHGDHKGHGGGAGKDIKTSVHNSASLGDRKGHEEEIRQIFKKPLCTLCLRAKFSVPPMPFSDLTEFTKKTERTWREKQTNH